MEANAVRFAEAARRLAAAARADGLDVPTFRSPPRRATLRRSVRRRPDGSTAVSVQTRGRPLVAVVADMIDGIVAVNELDDAAADRVHDSMWAAMTSEVGPLAVVHEAA